MARIKMSAPWDVFYREINELFKEDPDIKVVYDEETKEIKLYVKSNAKATALCEVLPSEMTYGNVSQKITIVSANGLSKKVNTTANDFATVFNGNPVMEYIETVGSGVFSNPITYVVFKNQVVQYFNDDIGDVYGQCSTLYQDIAKDVFGEVEGVYFCTEKPKPNGIITIAR